MSNKIVIGIDPDVEKSGCCVIYPNKEMKLYTLSFPLLLEKILNIFSLNEVIVIVEAGWLNSKSDFSLNEGKVKYINGEKYVKYLDALIASKKAKDTGSNHAVGRLLIDMLQYHKVEVKEMKPLSKSRWSGNKCSREELNNVLERNGYATFKQNNQEQRDATLIALSYLGTM